MKDDVREVINALRALPKDRDPRSALAITEAIRTLEEGTSAKVGLVTGLASDALIAIKAVAFLVDERELILSASEFVHTRYGNRLPSTLGEVLTVSSEGAWYIPGPDMDPVMVDTRRVPVEGPEPVTLVVLQDVTDWKEIEAELRTASEAAEASSRAKADFLATMSHEIRTPMNGVIGMTGLLLDMTMTEEQVDCVQSIRTSAENLLGIINDILDFSKIEAQHLELEDLDFDVSAVIEEVVEVLAPTAHNRGLEIIADIDDSVPSCLGGDPSRLRQILNNLIGNAIKFTVEGQVVVRVWQLEGHDDIRLRFEVRDSGIGIPADVVRSLFLAFTQADSSTTRKFGGTGLGLAICKSLTSLMGGEIGVDSQVGSGSCFWFELPFGVRESASTPDPNGGLAGKRVLVVDDNPAILDVVLHYCSSLGMVAEGADSGQAALDRLKEASAGSEPFDCMITDLRMDEMDGLDLSRAVRGELQDKTLPILMLSSWMGRAQGRTAREAGASGVLGKPVKREQFRRAVTKLFEPKLASPKLAGLFESSTRTPAIEGLVIKDLIPVTAKSEAEFAKRVLVAEDNLINQKVIARILKKMGFAVSVADNGREALDLLEKEHFDVILMDCQMPVMDGFACTRAIRAMDSAKAEVPIIAITANAMQGDRDRCLEAGMDDYLAKPVRPEILQRVLDTWCAKNPIE
jgi:signal transduction histidine kinase/DNA-binding response OmpR family regulator